MDTLTQGLLGGTAAQLVLGPRLGNRAWIAGFAGGVLPDADVLLRPLADPALPFELHRHFTHGLVMAPVMGLLAVLPLLLFRGMRGSVRLVLLAGVLGALTHGPLDWCTSYGTKLLWPFSLESLTLDLYPIVDPLFTLVLLVGVIAAARRRRRWPAVATWLFLLLYTGLALGQHARAEDLQARLVARRGQVAERARVLPLPGSLLLWRSLYEADGVLHADMLRPLPFGEASFAPGGSRPRLDVPALLRRMPVESRDRVADVLARFARFADGYVALAPGDPSLVADMRFTTSPGFEPLWGLRLPGAAGEDIAWRMPGRAHAGRVGDLIAAITGAYTDLRPLPRN